MSTHVRLVLVYRGTGSTDLENALEEGFDLFQTTVAGDGVYYLLFKPKEAI